MTAIQAPRPPALLSPLRFLAAGSVDDGKSTLMGRLLLDSRSVLRDQLDTLTRRGGGTPDLSLFTDGLEAEREQGITIDVAYRYFATPARKFIMADAPGHEQYTRNMVTAASNCDACVVLVDITKLDLTHRPLTLLPQTRRHALLAHLLGVSAIVFAVNKLDAVLRPEAGFRAVQEALTEFASALGLKVAAIVPVSALRGDNVVLDVHAGQSPWSAWHRGPSLLQLLETLPTAAPLTTLWPGTARPPLRLPVQYISREGDGCNPTRVLWGRIGSGQVQAGDRVQVLPSGEQATVRAMRTIRHGHGGSQQPADDAGGQLDGSRKSQAAVDALATSVTRAARQPSAHAGLSVGLVLDRHVDVSRGDWLVTPQSLAPSTRCRATVAWLDADAASVGRRYLARHGHHWTHARISRIHHRLDIDSLAPQTTEDLRMNDIAEVDLEFQQPLPLLPYKLARDAGALILVDAGSHATSGAVLVLQA